MTKLLKKFLFFGTLVFLIASILAGLSPNIWVDQGVKILLTFYLLLVFFRAIFFFFAIFRERVEDYYLESLPQDEFARPFVSVIVPCYNEEDVIGKSLTNLLNLDYPFYEVLVVNDGSTDSTGGIIDYMMTQSARCSVRSITQPNQGKAHALNNAIQMAAGDIILCVDADSKIQPGSLAKGARHFRDPEVGAVAGFVEIANQVNLLTLLQQLEYLVGLNFARRALSFMGVVAIVPGPAGMFRRKALIDVGGYKTDTELFAEDAELTLRILSKGWKVKSEEEMIAVTEAPETIMPLLRQRYRWNRGTFQALLLNIKSLLTKCGWRGLWVGSYLFMEGVITPILNFGLILYFFGFFVRSGEVNIFTIWYAFLLCVDILTTAIAIQGRGQFFKWLGITVFNKVGYYYMLLTWRLLSLSEEWLGKEMSWDKLERTGRLGESNR